MNIYGSFKRYVFTFLTAVFALFSFFISQAQNLRISGSNNHSVVICANGNVFAWGKNNDGQLGLDPNTNAPYGVASSTTPLRVGGLGEIFQIDAGSGSHTLALTCQGKVYAWGTNAFGQLGNNTDAPGASSAKPVLVKAGATGTGDLMGVKYVSGGNDESYALLNTGEAVAWGQNDKGQLGDGTTTNRAAPVYITNGLTGGRLTNIIQIEAGDENGYALTADGRVWSWGDAADGAGVALGRSNITQNTRAYPVQVRGGADLTGIKEISAGDRHALALSNSGQVYSWGGDWGSGQLGLGTGYQNPLYASLVVGGAAGGTYLGDTDPVVSIAAGQAHSVVATASGRVYSWGSNGLFNCGTGCSTPAGQLGTNSLTTQASYSNNSNAGPNESPMLSLNGNASFNNAVSVSDGDAWSFVLTSDGKIYGSGWNQEGQLAIAGNANQYVFREINIPNCGVTAPCPSIDLGPDLKFCKTFTHEFSAGTVYPDFVAILYKNDVVRDSVRIARTAAAREVTFTVNEYAAEWKIEIRDRRGPTDRPCDPCPIARDSIKIEEYVPTFTDPGNLTYCGDTLRQNVLPNAQAGKDPAYFWFSGPANATPVLDTTYGSGKGMILLSAPGVTKAANGDVTLYAEERGYASGLVFRKAQSCEPTFRSTFEYINNNQNQNPNNQTQYVAYEPITLVETKITVRISVNNINTTVTGNVNLGVYGTKLDNNGNPIADQTKLLKAVTARVSATRDGGSVDKYIVEYTVPINLNIPGTPAGYYFYISPQPVALTGLTGGGGVEIALAGCNQTYPVVDNVNGNILKQTGMSQAFQNFVTPAKGGHFYDTKFQTGQRYCYRLPVVLKESCPCNKPTSVDLRNTKALSTRCFGDTLTLKGEYKNAGKPLLNGSMYYVWYKQGATVTAANYTSLTAPNPVTSTATFPVANNSLSPVATATGGKWVLRVQDGNDPAKTSCFTEDTVTVTVVPIPTFTKKNAVRCGGSVDLDTLISNPIPSGATFTFYSDTTGAPLGAGNVVTTSGVYYARATTPTGSCSNKFLYGRVTVTINPLPAKPTITVAPVKTAFCVGETHTLSAVSGTGTTATFAWTGDGTGATASTAGKTAAGTYRYIVQATDNGCRSDTASQKITVNALPTASITGGTQVCKEATPSLALTLTGKAPFTVEYTDNASAAQSTPVAASPGSITVPANVTGTFTLTKVTDANGCVATAFAASPSTTVTRFLDLNVTTPTVTCNFVTKAATIKFDVTDGKPAYTFPTTTPAAGAYAAPTYTATFPAAGSTAYNYVVKDATNCLANTVTRSGTINCDCPVTGVIDTVVGVKRTICNDGVTKTKIQVTVAGSNQAPPVYDFVIKTPSGTLTKAQATSVVGNVYTYDVIEKGTYTLQSVGDQSCTGSGSGSAIVDHFPDPKANLVPTDTTFCKDGTDKGTVGINVAPSRANYTVVIARSVDGDTTITLTSTSGTITSKTAQVFSIKSLSDANGCSAKASDLARPVTLLGTAPPVAAITAPVAVTSPNSGTYTFNTTPFTNLVATDPGAAYVGAWAVQKTTGTGTPALTGSNSSFTNGISGMNDNDEAKVTWTVSDPKGVCTVPAVATINLVRKPITEALAKNDTVCVSVGNYTQTPIETPKTALGEQAEWTAVNGAPAPATGSTLSVALPAAGIYQYDYRIYNPTILDGAGNAIESRIRYTIVVDDLVTAADADTTNGSLEICSTPFGLKGNTPSAVKGETGKWTGSATFVDNTYHVTNITGLTDGSSYPLTWTITSKYKKCPVSQDVVTYNKLQDITKPTIQPVTDVCSGVDVNLVANAPNAGNNETGTWTSNDLTIPASGVNTPNLTIPKADLAALKTYALVWTITSTSCPGGTGFPISFKVDQAPTVLGITAVDPVCEGNSGDYLANGVSPKFAFDVSYAWSTTSMSAGNPSRNFIGPTTQTSSKIEFVSSPTYLEELDSATVVLDVRNACGTTQVAHPVIWRLKPRKAGLIDGSAGICQTAPGVYAYGIEAQPNTTRYDWDLDGRALSDTARFAGPPATDSVWVHPGDWAGLSGTVDLTLTLGNQCGTGAKTVLPIQIIDPSNIAVSLASDKSVNKFCEPEDKVLVTATPTTNLPGGYVAGTYRFYVNAIVLGTEKATITTPAAVPPFQHEFQVGDLKDGDKVFVELTAADGQCLSGFVATSVITMDGYNYPTISLASPDTLICDVDNPILLGVSIGNDKNVSAIDWKKDGDIQPQLNGVRQFTLGTPAESGRYQAIVRGKVCLSDVESKIIEEKIFESPRPAFAVNPLVIYYSEASPGIPMPYLTHGLFGPDSIIRSETFYNNGLWLNRTDTVSPIIRTTKDELTVDYWLTVATGTTDPARERTVCRGSQKITVINALPLRIPNAFSPNNDGKNETWVIDGLNKYPDVRVRVFNRWGNSMFTDQDGVYEPWDGRTNGAELASGTYYYVIDLKGSPDGTDGVQVGSLTIVR